MRVFYCDHHEVHLPPEHRFPMEKYALLRQALVERGVLSRTELEPAPLAELADIERVHDAQYVRAFCEGRLERSAQTRIGFPWSLGLVVGALRARPAPGARSSDR